MRHLLGLLVALFAGATFAQPQDIRVPVGLHGDGVDRAMPAFARDVMARYRDDDRARFLDTLFRLQIAAGQQARAIESIEALRALRNDPASQPPLFLQYELHARAQALQKARGLPYAQAWRQVFAERFAALDDAVALRAEFSFGGSLPRWRSSLDAALEKARGRKRLPLAEAIELVRAWQVKAAPTVLFLGPGGQEVADRLVGGSPDFYSAYLDGRLERARQALGK